MPAGEQVFLSGIIGSNRVTLTTIKKRAPNVALFLRCMNGEGFNSLISGSADFEQARCGRKPPVPM